MSELTVQQIRDWAERRVDKAYCDWHRAHVERLAINSEIEPNEARLKEDLRLIYRTRMFTYLNLLTDIDLGELLE